MGPLGRRRPPFCSSLMHILANLGAFWGDVGGKWDPYETCTGVSGLHVCPSSWSHVRHDFSQKCAPGRSWDSFWSKSDNFYALEGL